jgi:hypothetical protein
MTKQQLERMSLEDMAQMTAEQVAALGSLVEHLSQWQRQVLVDAGLLDE